MYRDLILLLACLGTVAYGNVTTPKAPDGEGYIVGGEDTTIELFPYQISLRYLNSHICGGSILKERLIVTAAHCIFSESVSDYSVSYGSTNVKNGQTVVAERLLKHEKFNSDTLDYDIALVFLKSDIIFSSSAQPIKLSSEEPASGTSVVVTGWGALTEGGNYPIILQKVVVKIIDSRTCTKQYEGFKEITSRMLCAGVPEGGKDSCHADSGGPLVANGLLVGVVSWGKGCARPDFSGVYANVANLKGWIDSNSV